MWEFRLFLACCVIVFVLASCVYRKNIRSFRRFLIAIGVFIGGLVMHELSVLLEPRGSNAFNPALAAPTACWMLSLLGSWSIYASLPLFLLACFGGDVAYAQCSHCGYNLTGNASGVCPECGKDLSGHGGPRETGE